MATNKTTGISVFMDIKELTELGLTENQARVYLSLLREPEQTAPELAKKLSIDGSFAYSILKQFDE